MRSSKVSMPLKARLGLRGAFSALGKSMLSPSTTASSQASSAPWRKGETSAKTPFSRKAYLSRGRIPSGSASLRNFFRLRSEAKLKTTWRFSLPQVRMAELTASQGRSMSSGLGKNSWKECTPRSRSSRPAASTPMTRGSKKQAVWPLSQGMRTVSRRQRAEGWTKSASSEARAEARPA